MIKLLSDFSIFFVAYIKGSMITIGQIRTELMDSVC